MDPLLDLAYSILDYRFCVTNPLTGLSWVMDGFDVVFLISRWYSPIWWRVRAVYQWYREMEPPID